MSKAEELEKALSGDAINDEPDPIPTDERPTWELVIDDMRARSEMGFEKYGTHLQPNNGRDSLVDAYQEALDLAVYIKNEIRKRDRNDGAGQ